MSRRFRQGIYKPNNPKKYIGDVTNIVYRSSWELKFFKNVDNNPSVLGWSAEEVVIPYLSPVDNRMHRYFTDVLVVAKGKDGNKVVTLIEIKPYAQTKPPRKTKSKDSVRLLQETKTFVVNQAKWEAARKYCEHKGWAFKVLTEKDINFK